MIFLPFIMIDLVVSSVLMSLGMLMVPPVMIALPLKALIFILIDGWNLVARSLLRSFHGSQEVFIKDPATCKGCRAAPDTCLFLCQCHAVDHLLQLARTAYVEIVRGRGMQQDVDVPVCLGQPLALRKQPGSVNSAGGNSGWRSNIALQCCSALSASPLS